MHARHIEFDPYSDNKGVRIVTKIEWIRTSEAAGILNVKTTHGVLFIVRPAGKWIVRFLNVGTDDKPRFMLAKEDIVALANKRKSQTDL